MTAKMGMPRTAAVGSLCGAREVGGPVSKGPTVPIKKKKVVLGACGAAPARPGPAGDAGDR